ncbi:type IV secretory system conjugative DNA transfer family protein [Maribacter sp. PR1]|uniref:Type IV secretory system conjugative DNA transfer family protein n=1 Tax=Maribacter cobaltidurans TaxID=1178778 RepID=A0ABU7ITW8_9FLAO|nr:MULTISPECIES: type IV secretory system conjugative DNA transfer family protein [Maribacter]MDC6388837.1 type IV secretory system conjugative DNA transfer family protein [Maribacter sp. PR1]MEE1976226.1 type IV secretory system conjugative DNA transfer family protein [Maribacter cobaltidurans]
MQDKNKGYMGMYLSAFYFVIIAFREYYALYVYHYGQQPLLDKTYAYFVRSGLPTKGIMARMLLLGLLMGGIMIYRPIKKENIDRTKSVVGFIISLSILFISGLPYGASLSDMYITLMLLTCAYMGLMTYGMRLFQFLDFMNLAVKDPFNDANETFKQTEERIDTPHSVNIPYAYTHKGKQRRGWINFVNLFRSLLVIGTPGSGKSFSVIEEIMAQFIDKKFAMVIYDFKFDTLTRKANGYLQEAKKKQGDNSETPFPKLYRICFDDLRMTHKNNPMDPYRLTNQSDAIDTAATLMKNLNPEWIKRQDYFSRSAISYTGGCIWYLKKKSEETGNYICTPGHLTILTTVKIDILMEIMTKDVEVRQILVPFRDALEKEAMEQLSGQTSTVQISLSSMATKEIFYVMSGNDFSLDVNEPRYPKIVSLQNNPERKEVYSAPLGLYMNTILKQVNKPGKRPMALIIDEVPTLFIMLLRTIIDTGRENKIATILGLQSVGQLILDYGRELADVIYANCANVICGAAKGETARRLSELFGKIHQERISKNTSSSDVSTNWSTQMMELLPKSKVASMSTGHFAGILADTFEHQIPEKKCYGQLLPDIEGKERAMKHELPIVNDFRPADYKERFDAEMKLIRELELPKKTSLLFAREIGYIEFYGAHLDKVGKSSFTNGTKRRIFKSVVKELRLFEYKSSILELLNEGAGSLKWGKLFGHIIEEFLVQTEMDRVAQAKFDQIINEVDELVKEEYKRSTGKELKSAIFDEKKINGEIAKSLNNSETEVAEFMDNFEKELEDPEMSILADLEEESENIFEEKFSSHPIENFE